MGKVGEARFVSCSMCVRSFVFSFLKTSYNLKQKKTLCYYDINMYCLKKGK